VFKEVIIPEYVLTLSAGPGGTTSPVPGSYPYNEGVTVHIEAAPASGYYFVHWIEGANIYTDNPISVVMGTDRSLTALFSPIVVPPVYYTLTIEATAGGHTVPEANSYTYQEGTLVQVSAMPDTGYRLVEWREDGQPISTDQLIGITMNADRAIQAVFEEVVVPPQQYLVTISVVADGTTNPAPGTYTYQENETATIKAIPFEGYKFDHWEGDASGDVDTIALYVDGNKNVIAVFSEKQTSTVQTVFEASLIMVFIMMMASVSGRVQ